MSTPLSLPLTYSLVPSFSPSSSSLPPTLPPLSVNPTTPYSSDKRISYPIVLTLKLYGNATINEIAIAGHEHFSPSRIEVHAGIAPIDSDQADGPKYRKIGWINFTQPASAASGVTEMWDEQNQAVYYSDSATGETSWEKPSDAAIVPTLFRETKKLSIPSTSCNLIKLVVHSPHYSANNPHHQVTLTDISLIGLDTVTRHVHGVDSAGYAIRHNHRLVMAELLHGLSTDETEFQNLTDTEAALLIAGVPGDVVGEAAAALPPPSDLPLLKQLRDLISAAVADDDLHAAKSLSTLSTSLSYKASQVARLISDEHLAAASEDFETAEARQSERKAIEKDVEAVAAQWGLVGENVVYSSVAEKLAAHQSMSTAAATTTKENGGWGYESEKFVFLQPSLVQQEPLKKKKKTKGMIKVKDLDKIKEAPIQGAPSSHLPPDLQNSISEFFGDDCLTHLISGDSTRTSAVFAAITKGVQKKSEKKETFVVGRRNQSNLLNAIVIAAKMSPLELMPELIRCLFTRAGGCEAVFDPTAGVMMDNVMECLKQLFEVCEPAPDLLLDLSNEDWLGPCLVAAACWGATTAPDNSYEIVGRKLRSCACLVKEFGCLEDSCLDIADVTALVKTGFSHVNKNVKLASVDIFCALLEGGGVDARGLLPSLTEDIEMLQHMRRAVLAKELKEDDERLKKESAAAEQRTKQIEREAKLVTLKIAAETERLKAEAKLISDRLEEETRWRTKMRGAELLKFTGNVTAMAAVGEKQMKEVSKEKEIIAEEKKEEGKEALAKLAEDIDNMDTFVGEVERGEDHEEKKRAKAEEEERTQNEQADVDKKVAEDLEKKRLEEERLKNEDLSDEAKLEKMIADGAKKDKDGEKKKKRTKEEKEAERAAKKAAKAAKKAAEGGGAAEGGEEKKEEAAGGGEEKKEEATVEKEEKGGDKGDTSKRDAHFNEDADHLTQANIADFDKEMENVSAGSSKLSEGDKAVALVDEKKEEEEKAAEEKAAKEKKEENAEAENKLKAIVQKTSPRMEDLVSKTTAVAKVAAKVEEKVVVKKKGACVVS
jgi:hypothetical protein